MMFEFLEPHIERALHGQSREDKKACVFSVQESAVVALADTLAQPIPDQLLSLFQEVGYGFFDRSSSNSTTSANRLCHPLDIVAIMRGEFDGLSSDFVLEPNTLPFFERDLHLYCCLKPQSDNPNAVWWMWG